MTELTAQPEVTGQQAVLRVANISKEYQLGKGLFGRFGGAKKTSLKALDGVDSSNCAAVRCSRLWASPARASRRWPRSSSAR